MEKDNELIIPELNKETIEGMIYEIRGQKVMLDFDLARIYGNETKRFNEQVKRNINKFPEDLMFKLEPNEINLVKSQIATSRDNYYNGQIGGTRKPPYAFTESGVYMVITVLQEILMIISILLIELLLAIL